MNDWEATASKLGGIGRSLVFQLWKTGELASVRRWSSLSPGRWLRPAWPTQARSPLLQKFTTMLELDGVFEGMAWPDAERAAGIIAADLASTNPTAGRAMHDHAVGARRGADGIPWVDPQRAADALQDAAMICPRMFGGT